MWKKFKFFIHNFLVRIVSIVSIGQDCLSEHNKYRARHGSPPLYYDRTLEEFAMKRAEYMASTDIFAHPRNLPFGENLYWRSGRSATCSSALSMWYNEDKWYNYERGNFSPSTGHFTQMIWKATRYVGCASARSSRSGRMYIAVSSQRKVFIVATTHIFIFYSPHFFLPFLSFFRFLSFFSSPFSLLFFFPPYSYSSTPGSTFKSKTVQLLPSRQRSWTIQGQCSSCQVFLLL